MNSKTTIALFVIAITAIGMITAVSIMGSEDAFAKKGKSCSHHGCKGTKGYYTTKGHHHCFKGSSGCKSNKYH